MQRKHTKYGLKFAKTDFFSGLRFKCEAFLIKALSKTKDFKPSNNWLGLFSPINKIKESGLWLVNELSLERSSN